MRMLWRVLVLTCSMGGAALAAEGWVIEWRNTPIRGAERQTSEDVTMSVSDNRVRITQDRIISIYDYGKGRLSVLNPKSKTYWSGTIDTYVKETTRRRNQSLQSKFGLEQPLEDDAMTVKESDLPEITIERTDEPLQLAGYATKKYVIRAADELFQELWVAEGLDVSASIDPEVFLSFQRKSSANMIGKSAGPYNALYRSEDYKKLLATGYALKTVTHHIAGGFEQKARSVQKAQVEATQFAVPDGYTRVSVIDVFRGMGEER